jgi:hypothetical protein
MQNVQHVPNGHKGSNGSKQQRIHLTSSHWDEVYKTMDFRLLIPNIKKVSKKRLWRLALMCLGQLGFVLKMNGTNKYELCLEDPETILEFRAYINDNLDTLGLKSETIN